MNVEFILFLTDDNFALQYVVFMRESQNSQEYVTKHGTLHNIYYVAFYCYNRGMICNVYYSVNGLLHRLYGPAALQYNDKGYISNISFYINQKPHPHYKPYVISADYDGKIISMTEYTGDTDKYRMFPIESELDPDIVKMFKCKNEFQLIHFDK